MINLVLDGITLRNQQELDILPKWHSEKYEFDILLSLGACNSFGIDFFCDNAYIILKEGAYYKLGINWWYQMV